MKWWKSLPLSTRAPVVFALCVSSGLSFWPWLCATVLLNLSGWHLSPDGAAWMMAVGSLLGLLIAGVWLGARLAEP